MFDLNYDGLYHGGYMESVNNEDQIKSLKDNKIIGNPILNKTKINFAGKGNILYCDTKVKISDSSINFKGDNSLIYLSSSNSNYSLNVQVSHDSVLYFGKDNNLVPKMSINAQEHKNVIIGDDCSISSNVRLRTTDAHSFYSTKTKTRVNYSGSIYIGDHVFLGHNAYIEKGVHIGSGAIIENNAHVNSNVHLKSNCLFGGNPVRLLGEDLFFVKDFPANNDVEGTVNSEDYKSNVFLYENVPGETLDLVKIDSLLDNFSVTEKIDFIQKLFVQNKKQNRFSI